MLEFDNNDLDLDLAKIKVAYSGNINDYIGDDIFEGVDFISVDDKSDDEINVSLKDSDLVFIIADDKTSTIAKLSREIGALTIAIVESEDDKTRDIDTFFVVDDSKKIVVSNIIKAIADLIAVPGLVNLDFTDIKSVLGNAGRAYVGIGEAVGKNATIEAVKAAINNIGDISKSRSLLLNILGATDSLSMMEVNGASIEIQEAAHEDAEIIWGVSVDESLGNKIKVTIVAAKCTD